MAKKNGNSRKEPKTSGKEPLKFFDLENSTNRVIAGILIFLAALIITLGYFGYAGWAGKVLSKTFLFLFGRGMWAVPLLGVLIALRLIKGTLKKFSIPVFISALGFLFLLCAILGLLSYGENYLGGNVGRILSFPLLKIFGFWASLIIFVGLFIVSLLVVSGIKFGSKTADTEQKSVAGAKPIGSFVSRVFFGCGFRSKPISGGTVMEENNVVLVPQAEAEKEAAEKERSKKMPKETSEFSFKQAGAVSPYTFPPLEFLESDSGRPTVGDIRANASIIKRTLQNFGIEVEMGEVNIGPTVTQYTLKPAEGIKLARITTLSNDLSLALASHPLRIEAPIPGRSLVGIELPNRGRTFVRLRNLLQDEAFANSPPLTFTLGRDVAGTPIFADLGRMPHMLIAGSTGSGKTIALNCLILSLIYRNSPETLRFILIDPKRVEFPIYNELPHLLTPAIVEPELTVNALRWAVKEMERRFEVLSKTKNRDLAMYNEWATKKKEPLLPYIVIAIDELADLMMARGKEVEAGIVRLAQMARAVGIHLVVATQRPSVEVITGLIKANITSRIAFQVASQVDSRTILDMAGAEKLLGRGDMLWLSAETAKPRRLQGAYVSEKEVRRVAQFIKDAYRPMISGEEGEGEEKEKEMGAEAEEDLRPAVLFNVGQPQAKESTTTAEPVGLQQVLGPKAKMEPETDQKSDVLGASLQEELSSKRNNDDFFESEGSDEELYEQARKLVIQTRKASASFLQRRLRLGYARAARLIDMLEDRGVVGPGEGAKPRDVYLPEDEES